VPEACSGEAGVGQTNGPRARHRREHALALAGAQINAMLEDRPRACAARCLPERGAGRCRRASDNAWQVFGRVARRAFAERARCDLLEGEQVLRQIRLLRSGQAQREGAVVVRNDVTERSETPKRSSAECSAARLAPTGAAAPREQELAARKATIPGRMRLRIHAWWTTMREIQLKKRAGSSSRDRIRDGVGPPQRISLSSRISRSSAGAARAVAWLLRSQGLSLRPCWSSVERGRFGTSHA
jgi:hypothetical protein